MSDVAAPSPPDPVVRFRIRAILMATTMLAIAAALASPFWRRQAPEAQFALMIYWLGIISFGALAAWINWRSAWRHSPQAGPISLVLWLGRRTRLYGTGRSIAIALWIAAVAVVVAMQSTVIAGRGERLSMGEGLLHGVQGFAHGFMFGGALLVFMRRPIYLCDLGLSGGVGFIPWKYIRSVEWPPDSAGVMKFRRLDGDLYVRVPSDMREEVEAFVVQKTSLILAEPTPTPS